MELKKKTLIWEENNEPPKNYIWVKGDGKAYEYDYISKNWIESKSLPSSGNNSSSMGVTEVTYDELVNLRQQEKLIPGQSYRITDYVATTTQENTRAVEHYFDIIVIADTENTLNENARACKSERDVDGYFDNVHIEAWQLKYALDNDNERFIWADTENGKGVIYYLKDDYDNECGYDFKNIQYKRWAISELKQYTRVGEAPSGIMTNFVYSAENQICVVPTLDNNSNSYSVGEETAFYYTFSLIKPNDSYALLDASIILCENDEGCRCNNIENICFWEKGIRLPNNIVIVVAEDETSFECYSIKTDSHTYDNTFFDGSNYIEDINIIAGYDNIFGGYIDNITNCDHILGCLNQGTFINSSVHGEFDHVIVLDSSITVFDRCQGINVENSSVIGNIPNSCSIINSDVGFGDTDEYSRLSSLSNPPQALRSISCCSCTARGNSKLFIKFSEFSPEPLSIRAYLRLENINDANATDSKIEIKKTELPSFFNDNQQGLCVITTDMDGTPVYYHQGEMMKQLQELISKNTNS